MTSTIARRMKLRMGRSLPIHSRRVTSLGVVGRHGRSIQLNFARKLPMFYDWEH
jgi:hypothetical protein